MAPTPIDVLLAALNVVQVLGLAYIAARYGPGLSRVVKNLDGRSEPDDSAEQAQE